jgi:hypothetical protein
MSAGIGDAFMRKLLISLVVIVVAAAGLYAALAIYPTRVFRGSLDASIAALPQGYGASYKTARYSLFSHRAMVTGLAVRRAGPEGFDLSADEVDIVAPATDFADAWAHAATDPAKLAPDFALVIADEVTAKGVKFHNADTSATLASAHVMRPRVYPWALLHPGVPSIAEARALFLARAQMPMLSDVTPLLRAEASLILGIGYDGYDAQSFAATASMPATAQMQAATVSYTIQRFIAGRFDRGDGNGGNLDAMTMRSPFIGSLGIAHVALEGIAAQKPLTRLLGGEPLSAAMLDGLALKRVSYGPMSIQGESGPPVVLGTFTLANVAFAHDVLVSGDLAFEGFRIGRGQIPNLEAVEMFNQLGIDTMTVNLALGYRWDMDRRRLSIHGATLKVNELGALALSLEVGDVGSAQDLLAKGRLVRAELRYDDASLAARALKIAADQRGTDPKSLREQLIDTATQISAAPGISPVTAATARALSDFLAAPHSLKIVLVPPDPLPLAEFLVASRMPPDMLLPKLGITVSANR